MGLVERLETIRRNSEIKNRVSNFVFGLLKDLVLGLGLDFVALQDLDIGAGHLGGGRLGRDSGVVAMAAG